MRVKKRLVSILNIVHLRGENDRTSTYLFMVQIHSFCSICSPWWNLYKDLYLGTERVLIKEERKRNMLKKSKQILDNKMLVAQCPHMMNQSALRMQLLHVSRPFQAVG